MDRTETLSEPRTTTTPDDSCPTVIRPWIDAIVDARGHDPRSSYVERYWVATIGPSAAWIMRRLADEFDLAPNGFEIDLAATARSLGMSYRRRKQSPFGRALHWCVIFGLNRPSADGFEVRRRVPNLPYRQLRRLPEDFRDEHPAWARLGSTCERRDLERSLVDAGVPPAAAARTGEVISLHR